MKTEELARSVVEHKEGEKKMPAVVVNATVKQEITAELVGSNAMTVPTGSTPVEDPFKPHADIPDSLLIQIQLSSRTGE